MAKLSVQSCLAEFVGTYLLVLTVGCNVLSSNPNWGGVSIASVLMVMIYALGGVSGANFNPAVSLALGLAGKMEDGWKQVGAYSVVQIFAGLLASVTYALLFQDTFAVGPTAGFTWWQAMICELLYTFMLCFVVLNTAASKKLGGNNQFYGLAIGYVIVAGAYGSGAVSGGCFNPAVAIGIDAVGYSSGFGWCLLYTVFELIGATLAVAGFILMRPEEKYLGLEAPSEYGLQSKIVGEAIGTFFLVVTVGMNVLVASKAAAFSIAASLMVMIYSIGDVSGGHFNPAVTLAVVISGKIPHKEAGYYVAMQLAAGVLGAMVYELVHGGDTFPLGPGLGFDWSSVAVAEIIFTFVLCFVVLCVAAVKVPPAPQFTGFIIGMCITVGGLAIGKVSGGSLNPAVSLGIASARFSIGHGSFFPGVLYMIFELVGAAMASGMFRLSHPEEFAEGAEKLPVAGY
uniref:Aquaporin n=1 Tax=Alexandrium catenella TaxID=2925 RepID=A0A7S1PSQ1_ALECA|mmetsp:Transcript_108355/g.288350  ORF Transcript_108355/g.288350 Transcript_108355/m.288350 type:complete len:456 (+) Transcript_108355:97-1464(+)